jgi:probable phosphoglycerate mutase
MTLRHNTPARTRYLNTLIKQAILAVKWSDVIPCCGDASNAYTLHISKRCQNLIYLVRHGETIWNREGRRQGRGDSPLTPTGIRQAEIVGQRLCREPIDTNIIQVISSPLDRASTTASIIAECLGGKGTDVVVEPLLIELDVGCWEGLTNDQVRDLYPRERKQRRRNRWEYIIPGGESYQAVFKRSVAWLSSVSMDSMVIAVTHEMISRTIRGAYCRLTPSSTLELRHPHNIAYRLNEGTVKEMVCD